MSLRTLAACMLAALILPALMVPPAGAFHNPPYPLLASEPFVNNGWASFHIHVPAGGAQVSVEVARAPPYSTLKEVSLGAFVIDLAGKQQPAGVVGSSGAYGDVTYVKAASPVGTLVNQVNQENPGYCGYCTVGVGLTWQGDLLLPAGDWLVVGIAVGTGTQSGVVTVNADPNVQLVGAAHGSEAFYFQDTDFQGVANAMVLKARVGGVKAQVAESVQQHIAHRLVGSFFAYDSNVANFGDTFQQNAPTPLPVNLMSVDGPDGSQRAGWIWNRAGGDYSFTVNADAEAAYLGGVPRLRVAAADVVVP